MATTEYVVLRRMAEEKPPASPAAAAETPERWEVVGRLQAASQSSARREWYLAEFKDGTPAEVPHVVAVPVRSWDPKDMKPRLTFSS